MKATTKAHLAVLGTNLFFAGNYSLVKLISPSLIGPFALNLFRVGGSLIFFWVLRPFDKESRALSKQDLPRFLWCAVTGVALNQMLFVKGLTLTSTIHASLLILATPLVVTFFALWVLKESFTVFKALGLLLGVGGSVLLIMQKESSSQASDYLLGDLLILANAIFYAVYFILVKPLMKNYSPMQVIRLVFSFGFFMILPFGWKETTEAQWSAFHWQQMAALSSVIFTGTFLAYYFNAYSIHHLGAGITGTYIYTQPVFAVLIATIALHESFTWQKAFAAFLIFLGVWLVSFRRKT
ncbi:MAG: DMT family transporter [Flavisolibacter sp.]